MKKNLLKTAVVLLLGIVTQSCLTYQIEHVEGTVKFSPKKDDVFTNPKLRNYVAKTPNPSIVLRVPDAEKSILSESKYGNSNIYSAIEKELMKANFAVRDRALFNQTLKSGDNYDNIRKSTNTDLILEVIESAPIKLTTNRYTNKRGRAKTAKFPIVYYGFKVEFKIISVKENSLVGNYIFYYTPCLNGCTNTYYANGAIYPIGGYKSLPKSYEYRFDKNSVAEFYKISTQRLIKEIKK